MSTVVLAQAMQAVHTESMDVLDVEFVFDASEPYELSMVVFPGCVCGDCHPTFHGPAVVVFNFARELLDLALVRPGFKAGIGDISFEVIDHEFIRVVVAENAKLIVPLGEVRHFMIQTYLLVPAYAEVVDVDDALDKLLEGSA